MHTMHTMDEAIRMTYSYAQFIFSRLNPASFVQSLCCSEIDQTVQSLAAILTSKPSLTCSPRSRPLPKPRLTVLVQQ